MANPPPAGGARFGSDDQLDQDGHVSSTSNDNRHNSESDKKAKSGRVSRENGDDQDNEDEAQDELLNSQTEEEEGQETDEDEEEEEEEHDNYPHVLFPIKVESHGFKIAPRCTIVFGCRNEATFEWFFERNVGACQDGERYVIQTIPIESKYADHTYTCCLTLPRPSTQDEGEYTVIATTQGGLQTSVIFGLSLGFDFTPRLVSDSVEPSQCAPLTHKRYRQMIPDEDNRIHANPRQIIKKGHFLYFLDDDDHDFQVVSRTFCGRILREEFEKTVLMPLKEYMKANFPEAAAESAEEEETVNGVLSSGVLAGFGLPERFPLGNLRMLDFVHLQNAKETEDPELWRRIVTQVMVNLHNKELGAYEWMERDNSIYRRRPQFKLDQNHREKHDPLVSQKEKRKAHIEYKNELFRRAYSTSSSEVREKKEVVFIDNPEDIIEVEVMDPPPKMEPRIYKEGLRPFQQAEHTTFMDDDGIIEIKCFIYAFPLPTVQWFLEDDLIDSKRHPWSKNTECVTIDGKKVYYQKLRLDRQNKEEIITVTCRASNPYGQFDEVIVIDSLPPKGIRQAYEPVIRLHWEENAVELYCRILVESPNPQIAMTWERNGEQVITKHEEGLTMKCYQNGDGSVTISLIIEDPEKWEGEWRLLVSAEKGKESIEYEDRPYIAIWNVENPLNPAQPSIINKKSQVREIRDEKGNISQLNTVFTVHYTSDTTCYIEWFNPRGHQMKDDAGRVQAKYVQEEDKPYAECTMEINGARLVDSGEYICRLENAAGSIEIVFPLMFEPSYELDIYPKHFHGNKRLCPNYIANADKVIKTKKSTPKNGLRTTDQVKESCYLAEWKNENIDQLVEETLEESEEELNDEEIQEIGQNVQSIALASKATGAMKTGKSDSGDADDENSD